MRWFDFGLVGVAGITCKVVMSDGIGVEVDLFWKARPAIPSEASIQRGALSVSDPTPAKTCRPGYTKAGSGRRNDPGGHCRPPSPSEPCARPGPLGSEVCYVRCCCSVGYGDRYGFAHFLCVAPFYPKHQHTQSQRAPPSALAPPSRATIGHSTTVQRIWVTIAGRQLLASVRAYQLWAMPLRAASIAAPWPHCLVFVRPPGRGAPRA